MAHSALISTPTTMTLNTILFLSIFTPSINNRSTYYINIHVFSLCNHFFKLTNLLIFLKYYCFQLFFAPPYTNISSLSFIFGTPNFPATECAPNGLSIYLVGCGACSARLFVLRALTVRRKPLPAKLSIQKRVEQLVADKT